LKNLKKRGGIFLKFSRFKKEMKAFQTFQEQKGPNRGIPKISGSKRNLKTCSKLFRSKEKRTVAFQSFLEGKKNEKRRITLFRNKEEQTEFFFLNFRKEEEQTNLVQG